MTEQQNVQKKKTLFSQLKKCPLLLLLIFSSLFFTLIGIIGKSTLYDSYSTDYLKAPLLSVVMEGISDKIMPWELFNNELEETNSIGDLDLTDSDSNLTDPDSEDLNSNPENDSEDVLTPVEPNTSPKEFVSVGTNFLDDALFIGDSRIEGLSLYSQWENATFFSETGLTIHSLFEKDFIPIEGEHKKNMTLEQALSEQQFQKIYLMVGINELGRGTDEDFFEVYKSAVEKIKKLQPNAIVFVQAILKVSKEKDDEKTYINNDTINRRNALLSTLANQRDIFYIDSNDLLCDENGYLREEYTFDGVHLKASQYTPWKSSILEHGIILDNSDDITIPVNWSSLDSNKQKFIMDQFVPTLESNLDMDYVIRRLWWLANTIYNTDSLCFSIPPTTEVNNVYSSIGHIMQFIDYQSVTHHIFTENAQEQLEIAQLGNMPYLHFENREVYHLGPYKIPIFYEDYLESYVLLESADTVQHYEVTYKVLENVNGVEEYVYYTTPFDIVKIGERWYVDSYMYPEAKYPGY